MLIKLCGLKAVDDAVAAVEAGADLIGLVFAPSPRRIEPRAALEIATAVEGRIPLVGVVVDMPVGSLIRLVEQVPLTHLQLHGVESVARCAEVAARTGLPVVRAIGPRTSSPEAPFAGLHARLYDAKQPGSGREWDWSTVAGAPRDVPRWLAGGLSADNVERAILAARPDAVDVSSGIESAPGIKDHDEMRRFVATVRRLEAS